MTVPRFLCVGDIDVDLIVTVDALPDRDGKTNGRQVARAPGGMAANVAAALARLGGAVRLFGAIGADDAGAFAIAELRRAGVDVSRVVSLEGATTFSCISLITRAGEKSLVRLVTDAYLPPLRMLSPDVLTGISHVHMTFGSPALALHALNLAEAAGATRSLDLERADIPPDAAILRQALAKTDILFCNRETRSVLDATLGKPVATLAGIVVTTLGPQGSRLETAEGRDEAAGFPVAAVDTTGAGDSFAAGFLFAFLQQGSGRLDSLVFANAAAALSTLGYGAQSTLPGRAAVEAFLVREPRSATLSGD